MDTALALAPAPPLRSSTPRPAPAADVATWRTVTAHVTGGLDGALRVMAMLRSRRYRLRDLGLAVGEDGAGRVTCTVVLTTADLDLLLLRLRRLPAVVSAQRG
jgi:hypothetical protein